MQMRILGGTVVVAALALGAAGAGTSSRPAPAPAAVLEHGAPSVDALLARFVEALHANDWKRLRKLRMTEAEYRAIVLPGSVARGEPLRSYPDEVSRYFWQMNHAKSAYSEANLLQLFGGRRYRIVGVHWVEGEQEFATYRALRQLELSLVADGDGAQDARLRTGSIAEVNGRYTFISFVRS